MSRLALLLVATCGCDAFFGLEHQDPTVQLCGPYGVPVPVVFSGAALAGAYDLSLDATATHGLVRVGSGPNPTIIPIVQMPDQSYAEDPTRAGNLAMLRNTGLYQGHITSSVNHLIGGTAMQMGTLDPNIAADMFAAVLPTNSSAYQIQHLAFTKKAPPGWRLAENTTVDGPTDVSVFPGNELELTTNSVNLFTRYLSVVRVDAQKTRTVDVDQMFPNTALWIPEQVNHVSVADRINSLHVVQQAVLAFGSLPGATMLTHPLTLVYTATIVGGDSTPRIYASPKTAEGYGIGKQVSIAIEDGEFLEPWVTVDCSSLWFRRDATVYRADAM